MTRMSCAAVRRAIGPLHDGELAIAAQIPIEAHLASCTGCRSQRDELLTIQRLIRTGATRPESADYDDEMLSGVLSSVMSQIRQERCFGWRERVGRLMADASRVWIPGGAVICTAVGAVVLATVLSIMPNHRDSLAVGLHGLGIPGSNANPVLVARGVTLPMVSRGRRLPVFLSQTPDPLLPNVTLAAVVTREGELSRVEVLGASSAPNEFEDDLFQLAEEIRFSPALYAGSPVAVNVVWLLERTTVRGYLPVPAS